MSRITVPSVIAVVGCWIDTRSEAEEAALVDVLPNAIGAWLTPDRPQHKDGP